MIKTYSDYVEEPLSITLEESQKLHSEMIKEIGNDEEAVEIYNELIEKATEYSVLRSNWTTREREWKMDNDSRRTSKHNSLITHFNMLARYLKSIGKEALWRDKLGYEENDKYYRKRIGDFGCYLVFIHAINGR